MTPEISDRMASLRARRMGDAATIFANDSAIYKSESARSRELSAEEWERRGSANQQWTRYALGGMAAVSPIYTKVSIETGQRVANQLITRLQRLDIATDFRLQGSVPLDVHIKGVSDVDVLFLYTGYRTYDVDGL